MLKKILLGSLLILSLKGQASLQEAADFAWPANEVWLQIFNYCDAHTISSIQRVNHHFKNVSDDSDFFQEMCELLRFSKIQNVSWYASLKHALAFGRWENQALGLKAILTERSAPASATSLILKRALSLKSYPALLYFSEKWPSSLFLDPLPQETYRTFCREGVYKSLDITLQGLQEVHLSLKEQDHFSEGDLKRIRDLSERRYKLALQTIWYPYDLQDGLRLSAVRTLEDLGSNYRHIWSSLELVLLSNIILQVRYSDPSQALCQEILSITPNEGTFGEMYFLEFSMLVAFPKRDFPSYAEEVIQIYETRLTPAEREIFLKDLVTRYRLGFESDTVLYGLEMLLLQLFQSEIEEPHCSYLPFYETYLKAREDVHASALMEALHEPQEIRYKPIMRTF